MPHSHLVSIPNLLEIVPFMLGYKPDSGLVTVCTNRGECLAIIHTSRDTKLAPNDYELAIAKIIHMGADAVTVVLYSPDSTSLQYPPAQSDDLLISLVKSVLSESLIGVDEFVLIKDGHFTSLICENPECLERHGQVAALPGEISAELVFAGTPLPLSGLSELLSPLQPTELSKDKKFKALVTKRVGRRELRQGELAKGADLIEVSINSYLVTHQPPSEDESATLIALLQALHLRDFTLGLIESEKVSDFISLLLHLLSNAPEGRRTNIACILAVAYYETGKSNMAVHSISVALTDDPENKMANLLLGAFQAPWPPAAFKTLRQELHSHVKAIIYGEPITE